MNTIMGFGPHMELISDYSTPSENRPFSFCFVKEGCASMDILDAVIVLLDSKEVREAYIQANDDRRSEVTKAIWNMMTNTPSVHFMLP